MLIRSVYATVFVVTAAACFAALPRLSNVGDTDTRRGLTGLLVLSGLWALTHVGRVGPVAPGVQTVLHLAGLTVGLGSLGAWLYFCSACTGHDYHRRPAVRRIALGLYTLVCSVKLTTPIHDLYLTTSVATRPFPHVEIHPGSVFLIVTGVTYSLWAVGVIVLYETVSESRQDHQALYGSIAVMVLPVGLYPLSFGVGSLLTLHYEPLGVAVFGLGVLHVADEGFVALPRYWRERVFDASDGAVILVDEDSTVRDADDRAVKRFPALADGIGEDLSAVVPDLAEAMTGGGEVVTVDRSDGTPRRYYRLDSRPLTKGGLEVGRVLVCTEVTEVERRRRELERQNQQFDALAAAITHELRNTLTIADGYLEYVTDRHVVDEDSEIGTAYREIERSLARMDHTVTDLSRLARHSRTLQGTDQCQLHRVAESTFEDVEAPGLTMSVEGSRTVRADPARIADLFASAFRFAALRGSTRVDVAFESETISITTDCRPLSETDAERAFEYGTAVPSAGTGTLLPTVRTVARAHGWTVDLDPEYRGGVRIRIEGVVRTTRDTSRVTG